MISTIVKAMSGLMLPATRGGRLLVLIYHRVRPDADAMFPEEVDAHAFRRHMRLLRDYCEPLPLYGAATRLRSGQLPARACAVTFDDGYADNATVALPILQECGVPATFFVATGFLDGGRMWNDSIIESLRSTAQRTVDLTRIGLGTYELDGAGTRRAAAISIIRAVKHLAPDVRQRRVDEVCEILGAKLPAGLMMKREQVLELVRAGMEVGGHTVNHPILSSLSEADARDEIARNKRELEQITGRALRGFAYPNGRPERDYTQRDRNLVESIGFEYALSTTRGAGHAGSDPFQLPRFTPWDRGDVRWLGRLLLEFGNPR